MVLSDEFVARRLCTPGKSRGEGKAGILLSTHRPPLANSRPLMTPAPDMRCLAISYKKAVNWVFFYASTTMPSQSWSTRKNGQSKRKVVWPKLGITTYPFRSDIKHIYCTRRGTNEDMSTCWIESGGGHYRPTCVMEHINFR